MLAKLVSNNLVIFMFLFVCRILLYRPVMIKFQHNDMTLMSLENKIFTLEVQTKERERE